ncbi:MAG: 2-succinyl-5-enolpyruvyl-6-hydroxy-3-cyclohexene-1-carboxylic-acid synthase [Cytophagales bacterium]|nr:2-succinyl-5-enolpyruvyl-6-hydroxy-3-cyclohexene-1-carboxylic-acid synthase [Cytophagales bacterium]
MILQPIIDIASVCAGLGLRDVVLSPGSRCAHLSLAMVRHPEIKARTVSDERSAAFVALGISLKKKKASGIVCTSGTAAYNYAPAVAEAFYQQVPLVVFTTDRPPEWVGQQDGQTIQQQGLYNGHVKGFFQLPVALDHPDARWQMNRMVSEAVNLANSFPKGPVHVNLPIREPFYPQPEEQMDFPPVRLIQESASERRLPAGLWQVLGNEWDRHERVLIVGGQQQQDSEIMRKLSDFLESKNVPAAGDVISNLHADSRVVRLHDSFLLQNDLEALRPDLLVTFGLSVLSKPLKLFLRKHKPDAHWHIQEEGPVADTFQSLTRVLRTSPEHFFGEGVRHCSQKPEVFNDEWMRREENAAARQEHYFAEQADCFAELPVWNRLIKRLPESCDVHLANSMSVRYASSLGLSAAQGNIEVFANRGTCGIDGSVSTAVGAAMSTDRLTVLFTGDLSFFYDRNGLWHNYLPENLRIVLLNNGGGGIFRMIDGPARQPELEEYFETRNPLTAENSAADFGMAYYFCGNSLDLEKSYPEFLERDGRPKLLEIKTEGPVNKSVFEQYKSFITQ